MSDKILIDSKAITEACKAVNWRLGRIDGITFIEVYKRHERPEARINDSGAMSHEP